MNIKLNPSRYKMGGILFWVAAFLIVVAVIFIAILIMSVINATKRIETIKPKWDDVYLDCYNEALQIAADNGGDTNLVRYFWEIDIKPAGYGLIVQSESPDRPADGVLASILADSSTSSGWRSRSVETQTVTYSVMTVDQLNEWAMPAPDPLVPMRFYHRMFVRTNFDETTTNPPPLNQ